MTTTQAQPFLLVSTAKEQPEQLRMVAGLRTYCSKHRLDWDIVPVPEGGSLGRQFLRRMCKQQKRHGVIIGRQRPEAPDIPSERFPWLQWLEDAHPFRGDAGIGFDAQAVVHLAIDHLISQGAQSLAIAYAPRSGAGRISDDFLSCFQEHAAARNHAAVVLWQEEIQNKQERSDYFARLAAFCQRMPTPCGFFCVDDESAEWLVSDLLHLDISVSDSALVLGGSGSISAACARVPISSIRLPYHALGLAAAAQAHRLLSGGFATESLITVPPMLLDARRSTARAEKGQDPILKRAEQFVAQPHRPVPSVRQLANQCGCSRQYLLRCFRRALSRTPETWLRERALSRAAELLISTSLGLQEIAERCGMARASSLSVIFKKHYGQSPGAFRYSHQEL